MVVNGMLFINYPDKNHWREWDTDRMLCFNYRGGWCEVDENKLCDVQCLNLNSWHELYLKTRYCPFETDRLTRDVWISPDGKYYEGQAHEVEAEYLLDIIYGEDVEWCAGDKLEEKGWVRATVSMMWEVRFDEWTGKRITQAQYDALWDYCECHKLRFPDGVEVQ
jgi:hypothetical protein